MKRELKEPRALREGRRVELCESHEKRVESLTRSMFVSKMLKLNLMKRELKAWKR